MQRTPLAILAAVLVALTCFSGAAVAQTDGTDGADCSVVIEDDETILSLLGGGDGGIVVTTRKLFEIVVQLLTGNCV
jgi:hypothetical protein